MIYPTLFHVYSNSIDTYSDRPAFSLYEGETVTMEFLPKEWKVYSLSSFRPDFKKVTKLLCSVPVCQTGTFAILQRSPWEWS